MKFKELLLEQERKVDSKEFKFSVKNSVKKAIETTIKSTRARWQFDAIGLDLGLQYLGDDPQEAKDVIGDLIPKLIKLFRTKYKINPKKSSRILPGGLGQIVYTVSSKVEFFHKKEIGKIRIASDFGLLISR